MKVLIEDYKEVNRGAMKAFFTLVDVERGIKHLNCQYMVTPSNSFWKFPSREVVKEDGTKEYKPNILTYDIDTYRIMKDAVLEALKTAKPGEPRAKRTQEGYSDKLQGDAQPLWF